MADNEVFEVSRRLRTILGWFFAVLGLSSLGLLFVEWSPRLLIAALVLPAIGAQLVLSARNVKEIIVDEHSITFLPVGAEFSFSEAEKMHVPGWADRFDTPPDALGSIVLETRTERIRYVPGAILQLHNRCRLNLYGCDGNRMLRELRRRISE